MVPTIEEYDVMLGLPVKEMTKVYLYRGSYVDKRKVADLIGLPGNQTELTNRGSVLGWKRTLLENHLEALARQEDWDHFNKALALMIFGLILFDFTLNIIDQAAMDVFFSYETQGANLVPAIVADILLSLEICHQKKGGTLRCCNHLLFVWFITHLYAPGHMDENSDPFRSFYRIPIKDQTSYEWKRDFLMFRADHFPWVCPWYDSRSTIFSCGKFPKVPLMGSRGCIAYTPTIALRQLKWTQFVPRKEELGGLIFQYNASEANGQLEEVRVAWGNVIKKGERELGSPHAIATPEYKEWRANRRLVIPTPKETLQGEKSSQTTYHTLASVTSQLEVVKAHLRLAEEKEERAQTEIEILMKQSEVREMQIEEGTNPEIQIPKEDQEKEFVKENLQHDKAKAEQWRKLAKDYSDELMKRDQQEKELEGQIKALKLKQSQLISEVRKLKENKESIEGWKLIAKHHQDKKNELVKVCEGMADYIQTHATNLATRVYEVEEEVNFNPGIKLPFKTFKLVKYCQDLVNNFMRNGNGCN
ncbi:hypothetical protein SESBI_10420 [Sesbania bispinosa]|nr:hypothetical protein SESBI_10420 [Sesbania bispinosa]